jgi:hypothetical protein
MAKPPRKKRVNLDYECDAFGCRPKTQSGGGSSSIKTSKPKKRPNEPRPGPRFDTEVEKYPVLKNLPVQPETDVMLDIEEIDPKNKKTQLFRGTFQEAQQGNALKAAAEASKTFTPINFPKFQEQSRQSLLSGGADERTISPTANPGGKTTISKIPITKIHEQALRQQLGKNYDIAKEEKVASTTRYRTDPDGKRVAVEKTLFSPEAVTKINLATGRATITDLTTGDTKYQNSPDIEVNKKPTKVPVVNTSITEVEEEADVPEKEIKKAQLKAAVESSKKPGYFSKEAQRARKRKRHRSRYAGGAGGGRR